MSDVAQTKTNGFLARYAGLAGRLPGERHAREAAAAILRARGLPDRHDEAWHYTSLRSLDDTPFREPLLSIDDPTPLLALLPKVAAPRLIFVDGRYRADLSTPPAGLAIGDFAHAPMFGALARPEHEPLAALNTMLAEDGAIIRVPRDHDGGRLLLASLASDVHGHPVAFHPRHRLHLAAGARLILIEIAAGRGTYLHNPVTEAVLEEGATLIHVRLQTEAEEAFHLSTLYADLAAGATYDGFALNLGARLARTEIHARLGGPGATAHLNGAQLLRGRQHADFTTVVAHDAPNCASRQTVKNVLADRARGVFQGRIEVARGAQKTDGYQMNQALLLSPEAEIDSKPELRIYADDVKCSHGATVGELDADQLFYLRSRGIPEAEARSLLVRAFLAEALDPIADDAARALLDAAVETWWARAS